MTSPRELPRRELQPWEAQAREAQSLEPQSREAQRGELRRWELLRALGAMADSPVAARAVAAPLGLDPVGDDEHTEAFVLNCPPYAAVYLGPDGALGGEGADRAAGFWRALGLTPPAEPDHLTALLALYASLGEAAAGTG